MRFLNFDARDYLCVAEFFLSRLSWPGFDVLYSFVKLMKRESGFVMSRHVGFCYSKLMSVFFFGFCTALKNGRVCIPFRDRMDMQFPVYKVFHMFHGYATHLCHTQRNKSEKEPILLYADWQGL